MDAIEEVIRVLLELAVQLLLYVGLPFVIGAGVSFLVWKNSRRISLPVVRAGVRAVVVAFFFAPAVLIGGSPGLHGAIILPYFAWGSIWIGITESNPVALQVGSWSMALCFVIMWVALFFAKLR